MPSADNGGYPAPAGIHCETAELELYREIVRVYPKEDHGRYNSLLRRLEVSKPHSITQWRRGGRSAIRKVNLWSTPLP